MLFSVENKIFLLVVHLSLLHHYSSSSWCSFHCCYPSHDDNIQWVCDAMQWENVCLCVYIALFLMHAAAEKSAYRIPPYFARKVCIMCARSWIKFSYYFLPLQSYKVMQTHNKISPHFTSWELLSFYARCFFCYCSCLLLIACSSVQIMDSYYK